MGSEQTKISLNYDQEDDISIISIIQDPYQIKRNLSICGLFKNQKNYFCFYVRQMLLKSSKNRIRFICVDKELQFQIQFIVEYSNCIEEDFCQVINYDDISFDEIFGQKERQKLKKPLIYFKTLIQDLFKKLKQNREVKLFSSFKYFLFKDAQIKKIKVTLQSLFKKDISSDQKYQNYKFYIKHIENCNIFNLKLKIEKRLQLNREVLHEIECQFICEKQKRLKKIINYCMQKSIDNYLKIQIHSNTINEEYQIPYHVDVTDLFKIIQTSTTLSQVSIFGIKIANFNLMLKEYEKIQDKRVNNIKLNLLMEYQYNQNSQNSQIEIQALQNFLKLYPYISNLLININLFNLSIQNIKKLIKIIKSIDKDRSVRIKVCYKEKSNEMMNFTQLQKQLQRMQLLYILFFRLKDQKNINYINAYNVYFSLLPQLLLQRCQNNRQSIKKYKIFKRNTPLHIQSIIDNYKANKSNQFTFISIQSCLCLQSNMDKLVKLELVQSTINSSILQFCLTKCKGLKFLKLVELVLSSKGLQANQENNRFSLRQLINLDYLCIQKCNWFTDEVMKTFNNSIYSNLKVLRIDGQKISIRVLKEICSELKIIQYLQLKNFNFNGKFKGFEIKSFNINNLILQTCKGISTEQINTFIKYHPLKKINLINCEELDINKLEFNNLKQIQFFTYEQFTDQKVKITCLKQLFSKMQKLRHLSLCNVEFSQQNKIQIIKQQKISKLALKYCSGIIKLVNILLKKLPIQTLQIIGCQLDINSIEFCKSNTLKHLNYSIDDSQKRLNQASLNILKQKAISWKVVQ